MQQGSPYWRYTEYSYSKDNEGLRQIIWKVWGISISGGLGEHNTQTFGRWDIGIPDPPLRQWAGPGDFSSYDSMVLWGFFNPSTERVFI